MKKSNQPYINGVNTNIYKNAADISSLLFSRSKLYFRDIQSETQLSDAQTSSTVSSPLSSAYFTTPPIHGAYHHHHHHHHHQQYPTSMSIATTSSASENGICDGMNDCHLTDSWVKYMNQHVNLPISHIANQIPILNSYIPLSTPDSVALELQSLKNNLYQQQNYLLHRNYLNGASAGNITVGGGYYLNDHQRYKFVNMTDNNNSVLQIFNPQQQLFRDGFSRRAELDYEETNNHSNKKSESKNNENIYENDNQRCHSKDKIKLNNLTDDAVASTSSRSSSSFVVTNKISNNMLSNNIKNGKLSSTKNDDIDSNNEEEKIQNLFHYQRQQSSYRHNRIKTPCIKYQDRNKKLDFKIKFRDENRKINGCFYDSENKLSPKNQRNNEHAAAPKKKWIKNYLTNNSGIQYYYPSLNKNMIKKFFFA